LSFLQKISQYFPHKINRKFDCDPAKLKTASSQNNWCPSISPNPKSPNPKQVHTCSISKCSCFVGNNHTPYLQLYFSPNFQLL